MVKKLLLGVAAAGVVGSSSLFFLSNQNTAYAQGISQSYPAYSAFMGLENNKSILGHAVATEEQMLSFARSINPKFPADLPKLYLETGNRYGIRGDIAFCQMIKETGYQRYGGIVQSNQSNFAGIGAVGNSKTNKGNSFQNKQQGVLAHIQHLYAYASTHSLPVSEILVDPRFKYVTRGIAPNWQDLDGRWAVPGRGYGEDILRIYNQMLQF
jgi:hypothetical protein